MVHWSEAASARQAAVETYFDRTACTLQPMTRANGPNGDLSEDGSRAAFTFKATVDLEPQSEVIAGQKGIDPSVSYLSAAYDAMVSAYVDKWPYLPRRDDIITANGVSYCVVVSRKDGSNRRSFLLNVVKS